MELLPNKNDDYGSQNYWVDRFEKERTYEWLVNYSHIKDLIAKHVNKSASILILGGFNSLLQVANFLLLFNQQAVATVF